MTGEEDDNHEDPEETEEEPDVEGAHDEDQGHDGADDVEGEAEEDDDDPMTHLPGYVIKRVDYLKELHRKRDDLMADYIAKRAALENKYSAMFQPFYDERAQIIQGDKDEEIAALPDDRENNEENIESGEKVKGIPQFWVCAMTNNETIGELIGEDDVDCLESLKDIKCVDREDGKGFELFFYFSPNQYFENEVLTKTYEVPNLLLSDEPLLKNVKGTAIKWKEGRALTYRMIKKKQRGKGRHAGKVRTVSKKEDLESFFRWFEPPEMPPMDEIDEEQAEHLEEIFDDDYEVANAFRTGIIPHAVLWFTGEADEDQIFGALQEESADALEGEQPAE